MVWERLGVRAFADAYGAKFAKAVAKVTDDIDELLAFYDYPAEHWIHPDPTARAVYVKPGDPDAAIPDPTPLGHSQDGSNHRIGTPLPEAAGPPVHNS